MGLFVQNITLRISNGDYIVEKVELPPLGKDKIDLTVAPGTIAIIGGVKYKGQEMPHKLTRELIGSKKTSVEAYLCPDKFFDSISVTFFGGQHVVSISSLPTAKAKFSIVGTATVEVGDYKELANYFKRTLTRDDLAEEINNTVRAHLSNEVGTAASKYITPATTEVTLRGALESVAGDVMQSRKTATLLMNMGLMLSKKGISMHLNALDDADDKLRAINDALTDKALASLNEDTLDRQEREIAAARKHEIDVIRAQRADISESTSTNTQNINTNGNGHVTINNNNGKRGRHDSRFCPECGQSVQAGAKFCPNCGARQ